MTTHGSLANIEKLESDLWEAADNLRANSKLTSSEYCMPVLYAQKGSTREALTKEILSAFEITLPSPELVAHFGEIAECSFLQRETLAFQNQKLRTARDLLLPKLMSGEIGV